MAGGDVTKWNEILNLPFNDVFIKLRMNKDGNAYQKRYAELIQKQQDR